MYTSRNTVITGVFFLIMIMMVLGCVQSNTASEVYVSVLPQQYIVEHIVGDMITVDHVVPKVQNPEIYTPLPKTLKDLETAKVFFTIGMPYEARLLKSLSEKSALVRVHFMGEYVKYMDMNNYHAHEGDVSHVNQLDYSQKDIHVWMSVTNLNLLSRSTYETLAAIYPKHRKMLKKNYMIFQKNLALLDSTIDIILNPYRGNAFLIDHPALGYLADEYDLEQIGIQRQHGEEGGKNIREIIERANTLNITTIFAQKGFNTSTLKTIAHRIDASIVEIHPLQKNCFGNLLDIAYALEESFQR